MVSLPSENSFSPAAANDEAVVQAVLTADPEVLVNLENCASNTDWGELVEMVRDAKELLRLARALASGGKQES